MAISDLENLQYPEDPDRPEPVETTVEVTEGELQELEAFLGKLRELVIGHERRITNIETFLLAAMGGAEDEVDPGEGEGAVPQGEDNAQDAPPADGGGESSDPGRTDVPEEV